MFELIFFIFIGFIIYKRVQRVKQDGGIKGNNSLPNTTVTTPPAHDNTRPPVQPMVQPSPGRTAQARGPAQQTMQRTAAQTAIQEAKEDGNSTTAYLMEKAEADAREHAKEKFEEQKRLYETRGGLAVAERLLDGDPIPQGKHCVHCSYCGAENLVPMAPRTRYSCYFCREPL